MSNLISTSFTIETEQEDDGCWIAETLELPGALVYGDNQQHAVAHVKALALHVIADKQNYGEADLASS
ncbi:HicB family protein [filamentous cyanobacterium CCP3]|nr:HicB family protein [filamentous cyanobacterium CCP3]